MLITKFSILVFAEEPQTELHTFLLRVFYLLLHFNCEWIIFNSLILKVCIVKVMFFFFPSSHVYMWELDHKEDWVPKNWCFWTVVLEKTLESPLDSKEIKPVISKGNQFWIFMGRTDAEASILGHLMQRTDSFEKTLMVGKIDGGNEGDDRGWDDWMASLIQWTWVWGSSESWWWTGKSGVLQSMGSQRVRHNWVTELNWKSPKEIW